MRIGNKIIRPLIARKNVSAFDTMKLMYLAMHTPDHPMKFEDDLLEYMGNGYVYCSPTAMALYRPARDEDGNNYWFVQAAVGGLAELLSMMPCFLSHIAWARDNDGIIRKYKTERLLKISAARLKKGKG